MLLDANRSQEVASTLTADIVIIGAGTVGLFLMATLLGGGRANIVVIESGAKIAGTTANALHSGSIGKHHAGVLLGRASGLGGTSSLWGGQLAEFDRADLERPDAPWPLSFDELQKYYRVVYERMGLGEPEQTTFYRQRFGGEIARPAGAERFFTYWLRQPNFATVFRKLIVSEPSVRVVVNLTANDIDFDVGTARSMRCVSSSGRVITLTANRFVLACGTVAANRFFLSTARRGQVPWARNANLGRYFQDHLGGRIGSVDVQDQKRFRAFFENGWVKGIKLQPKLRLSATSRSKVASGACCFFGFDSSIAGNLANAKSVLRAIRSGLSFSSMAAILQDARAVSRSIMPIVLRYLKDRRVMALFDQGVSLIVQAEQIPLASSRIVLRGGAMAADGLYGVCVDWRCDGQELAAIHRLAIEADTYLREQRIGRLQLVPALQDRDPSLMDRLGDTYHQCGGLRMSSSPASGVVDENCLVWGTNNVWVAGAAVLPSSSHANCTLTALAIAARLATRVRAT
jgi:choline dehydrogenase-like flavoprotein